MIFITKIDIIMEEKFDNIYIYLWEEFDTIYVGRTKNPKSRHYAHKTRERVKGHTSLAMSIM